jgi:hypothetical protein
MLGRDRVQSLSTQHLAPNIGISSYAALISSARSVEVARLGAQLIPEAALWTAFRLDFRQALPRLYLAVTGEPEFDSLDLLDTHC